MIIWRGWGILVPFIAVAMWLFLPGVFKPVHAGKTHDGAGSLY